jgi:hypothetical protein
VIDNYTDSGEPIIKMSDYVLSILPKSYMQDFDFCRKMQIEGKLKKFKFNDATFAWLDNDQALYEFNDQAHERGYIDDEEYAYLTRTFMENPVVKKKSEVRRNPTSEDDSIKNIQNYIKNYIEQFNLLGSAEYKNFYEWQLKISKPVELISYKDDPEIKKMVEEYLENHSVEKKECFSNSYYLTMMFNDIEYVTGYAWDKLALPIGIEHGWNCYKGKHFDLTAEIAHGEMRFGKKYLQLLKLNARELYKAMKKTGYIESYWMHEYEKIKKKNPTKGMLYHLSSADFSKFKQTGDTLGFHFGTKDQALKIGEMSILRAKVRDYEIKPHFILYTVELDIKRPLKISENRGGNHGFMDLIDDIFKEAEKRSIPEINEKMIADRYNDIVKVGKTNIIDYSNSSSDKQLSVFSKFLSNLGFDSISYENEYEGEGLSYIVFDPEKIKIISKEKIDLSDYAKKLSEAELSYSPLGQIIINFKKQNPLSLIARGFDERPASAYDREELKLGIKTELEHTDDAIIASKIAKDHLDEDPHYYSKLVEMEKKMKNPILSTSDKSHEYLPIVQKTVMDISKTLDVWIEDGTSDILIGQMEFDEDRSKDEVLVRIKTNGRILEGKSVDESNRPAVNNMMKKVHGDLASYVMKKPNPKKKCKVTGTYPYKVSKKGAVIVGNNSQGKSKQLKKMNDSILSILVGKINDSLSGMEIHMDPDFDVKQINASAGPDGTVDYIFECGKKLDQDQQKALNKQWMGQLTDGWGEGFAQTEFFNEHLKGNSYNDYYFIPHTTKQKIEDALNSYHHIGKFKRDKEGRRVVKRRKNPFNDPMPEYVSRLFNKETKKEPKKKEPKIKREVKEKESKIKREVKEKPTDVYVYVYARKNDGWAGIIDNETQAINLPGGKIKPGEKEREAIIRIAREQGYELHGLSNWDIADKNKTWYSYFNKMHGPEVKKIEYYYAKDGCSEIPDYEQKDKIGHKTLSFKDIRSAKHSMSINSLQYELSWIAKVTDGNGDGFYNKMFDIKYLKNFQRKKENPVPKGVSKKKYDELVKTLSKKKDIDNPYALANWVLSKKKKKS